MKTAVDSRFPITDAERTAIEQKLAALTDEALASADHRVSIQHGRRIFVGEVRANHLNRTLIVEQVNVDVKQAPPAKAAAKKAAPKKAANKTAPKKSGKR